MPILKKVNIVMRMNWFNKFSQVEEAPSEGEASDIVVDPPGGDEGYSQVVFDGAAVNKLIEQRVIVPLKEISTLGAYNFLQSLPQDYLKTFLASLASDGMLQVFIESVQAYDPSVVIAGTKDALSLLGAWFDRFENSGGNRKPFDTLRNEVDRIVSV